LIYKYFKITTLFDSATYLHFYIKSVNLLFLVICFVNQITFRERFKMTIQTKPAKEITIEYIMGMTETPKTAGAVYNKLKSLLVTQKDRQEFVTRWINGYKGNQKSTTSIFKLAEEIGSYHYPDINS